jgi:hypothetical protein
MWDWFSLGGRIRTGEMSMMAPEGMGVVVKTPRPNFSHAILSDQILPTPSGKILGKGTPSGKFRNGKNEVITSVSTTDLWMCPTGAATAGSVPGTDLTNHFLPSEFSAIESALSDPFSRADQLRWSTVSILQTAPKTETRLFGKMKYLNNPKIP